jgi:ATP-dependent protease ClpP protease subunit
MKTTLIVLSLIAATLLAPLGVKMANRALPVKTSTTSVNPAAPEAKAIPATVVTLEDTSPVKNQEIKKTITLEEGTAVTLRGPVTGSSVAKAMKALQAASRRNSKDTHLQLVLDTPGGDIDAGNDLIDFAKALPQKVDTITLFAASMGFQIAQNLDTRYITRNGTLMSHRARVGGLGGQVKGELETRYRMIRRTVDQLDFVAATRMGMDTKAYETLVLNEYWVYGFDAVDAKAADEQVALRCGESMDGTEVVSFQTFFGDVKVTFSKCPLMKEPESIDFGNVMDSDRENVMSAIKMSLLQQTKFVDSYILTSKFSEMFR